MNISITKQHTRVVNLADTFQDKDYHIMEAINNLAHFGEYDGMDGMYIFILSEEDEDAVEEKMHDLLSLFSQLCELRVYESDGSISGIDFAEISVINQIDYKNAWTDNQRRDIARNGTLNRISSLIGESVTRYTNEDDINLYVFFNTKDYLEGDNFENYEHGLDENPLNDLDKFDAELSNALKALDTEIYGNIAVLPEYVAEKFYDLSTLTD